jgi:hypothetical protein
MKNGTQKHQPTPETEVSAKARRRRFTAEYKRERLEEADKHLAAGRTGEVAAMLRREGLYSSHLTEWRKARKRGELAGLAPRKRGPKAQPSDPRDRRISELEREVLRLHKRAERAEALVEVQKKISQLLGVLQPELTEER